MFNDLMANIEWFFTLHDKDKDGHLTKDEVLQLSESLLVCSSIRDNHLDLLNLGRPKFIFRSEPGDAYLAAVSRFMTNAFEYADAQLESHSETEDAQDSIGPNVPYLNLPTYVPLYPK